MTNIYRNDSILGKSGCIYRNDRLLKGNGNWKRTYIIEEILNSDPLVIWLYLGRPFKKNIEGYIKEENYNNAIKICEQNPDLIKYLSKNQMQILFRESLKKGKELEGKLK